MAARVRVRASEKGLRQSEVADAAGIGRSAMTKYWKGDRAYPVEALPKIAAKLAISLDALLADRDGPAALQLADDLVEVQEIDLAYGLGGTFSDVPVEVEVHRFPKVWLERITSSPPSLLTIARGRGDSMQPTLQDGDMVMIDRSQRTVREQDAIWALTVGDIAMIKRVRIRNGVVTLLSDNDRVPPDEATPDEVNVVGRVIFIGRRV